MYWCIFWVVWVLFTRGNPACKLVLNCPRPSPATDIIVDYIFQPSIIICLAYLFALVYTTTSWRFFFVRILSRNHVYLSAVEVTAMSKGLYIVTLHAFSRMPVEVFMHNFSCLWTNPFLYWIRRAPQIGSHLYIRLVIFAWCLYKNFNFCFQESYFIVAKVGVLFSLGKMAI